ncbi:hypothetical protein EHQ92_17985 [Leptospira biflexa]|uniref:hypothetical protein n=1 Tax=Leptospira biflexa TaxID=172 RepID=UPI001090BBE9|nr:hypothetical protein [Leptospira biflexa]TGM41725.1 hypothetical protein EHQ92_17985 [Leptospira biflexa]TGM42883.1 hypothetical protein EHQ88_18220 [Leptospira biflexa]
MWISKRKIVAFYFFLILFSASEGCKKRSNIVSDIEGKNKIKVESQSKELGLCLAAYSNDKKGYNSLLLFFRKEFGIDYTEKELEVASISGVRFFLSKDHLRTRRPHSNTLYEFKVTTDDLGILTFERNGKKIFLAGIISKSMANDLYYWIYTDYSVAKFALENKNKDPYQTTEIGKFAVYDNIKLESECLNQKEIDENFDQAVLEKSQGPEPTDEFSN